eukprot:1158129-Pelagomonas_calceolata.AAC.3
MRATTPHCMARSWIRPACTAARVELVPSLTAEPQGAWSKSSICGPGLHAHSKSDCANHAPRGVECHLANQKLNHTGTASTAHTHPTAHTHVPQGSKREGTRMKSAPAVIRCARGAENCTTPFTLPGYVMSSARTSRSNLALPVPRMMTCVCVCVCVCVRARGQ